MLWKKSIIEKYYPTKEVKTKSGFTKKYICGYRTGQTESLNRWTKFKKTLEGVEKLGSLGLAIWFMDDGGRSSQLVLHTENFEQELQEKLVQVLKTNFNINVEIKTYFNKNRQKNYSWLVGSTSEKRKVYEICKKHIPESMLFKFKPG
jgi:hypothetical protein